MKKSKINSTLNKIIILKQVLVKDQKIHKDLITKFYNEKENKFLIPLLNKTNKIFQQNQKCNTGETTAKLLDPELSSDFLKGVNFLEKVKKKERSLL